MACDIFHRNSDLRDMNYPIEYTAQVRVNYYDTDQMGVVWHGNYVKYFENAREEAFRDMGLPYGEIERSGIMMPIVDLTLSYHRPAGYDEVLTIKLRVEEPPRAKMVVVYDVFLPDGELCVTGSTTLGFIDAKTRMPCRAPALLRKTNS